MSDKIHINMRPMLLTMTVDQLINAANFAMNQLDLRELTELGLHIGVTFDIKLTKKDEPDVR